MLPEPVEATDLNIYGDAKLPWSRVADAVAEGLPRMESAVFLGTVGPDGRPHAAGMGAAESEGHLYFTSGPGTRKSRRLAANPACTVSARLPGVDLVLEGEAERTTDRAEIARVAAVYAAGGWPAEPTPDGDAITAPYSAQSAGPGPWHLYRFTARAAVGVALAEPFGATRWRFA
ncbi:pyridoxamine 5'-phosphate oxidase family protein [Actinomadura logoneensis]|uniref:Pyridoxamine 5'-phosphate oxidase family protein n=1 Tax=Actinomadura logoneensis TaxID=2293572 RepID=A0A372JJ27_9ACTN|nr:pyridoxamine 5'-phosphate oxidase family protein [Actinomadura logoneensis]RFU40023.1 pyridoxamine 5'-phosphate oxidase family protein [Actinomadura logoneensis]